MQRRLPRAVAAPAEPSTADLVLSPERQQLADAIARRDRLEADAAVLAAARPAASSAIIEARLRLDAAAGAIGEVTQAAETHAIDQLAGTVTTAPPDVEAARVEERRARDAYDAAMATRAEIDRRAEVTARALPLARMAVSDAAHTVVWSETGPARGHLAAEIARLQAELLDACGALSVIMGCAPRPLAASEDVHASAARQVECVPLGWSIASTAPRETMMRWWGAFDVLQRDPDAELPG
jgi:hypothetical protein